MEGFFQGVKEDTTQDPQLIEWAKQAGQIVDEARRKELYSMALKRIAEEAYWVPLHTYVTLYAFSSDLDFQQQPDEDARFYLAEWKSVRWGRIGHVALLSAAAGPCPPGDHRRFSRTLLPTAGFG